MKVVALYSVVRGDDNELHTLTDVFDVSEERGKELLELGAVAEVPDEKTADTQKGKQLESDQQTPVKRSPGRPRKH